ncbi:hypothetical protein KIM372_02460 [Bombiscardovia nodaiensis]|uniref:Uncharacterized protein n=1 Tax=Bombiscardovia nodaiensis TaxID=2932181 RepID=A0ABM8B671_9BIFI|nr:hypothetical protein KIM372_02460 [Bombiscardovia nodaiensis]
MADERVGLSQSQEEAVESLAQSNVYTQQSKWSTFRQLPAGQRWSFFYQHFLLGTIGVLVAIVIVASLVVTWLTKPPTPVLTVQAFNMSRYADQLASLQKDFVKQEGLKDGRLIDVDASMALDSKAAMDDSAKALTMISAGQINMIIAPRETFSIACKRGYVSKPAESLTKSQLAQVEAAGALVDAQGKPTTDSKAAQGLDLSRAATWKAKSGLPEGAILAFSNVNSGKDYPQQFVNFLKF